MKKKMLALFVLLAGMILTACGSDAGQKPAKKDDKDVLTVYTTVYPLQYFTERIGGKHVEVHSIYPPGADEHSFEPSQKDMISLAESDLFIYIGLGLEGFVEKAKQSLKNEDVTMIASAKDIQLEEGIHEDEHEDGSSHDDEGTGDEHGHNHGGIDPHIWLDPVYAKSMAAAIENALAAELPDHKADFEQNYNELISDLEALNQKFKDTAAGAKHKEIIVSHAAFGYWESRYGIKQMSIAGMSTASEPTQKDMKRIISTVRKAGIKYILVEQNVSSKLAKTVQAETGASIIPVHNLATLTEKNIKDKETYFSIMEKNIKTLNTAMNE
ncbi:zinc ABC transporter substrate-binding protein [Bacillus sp. FJAT-27445]|uniref:metal ABC transporter solute-binding protein, Zn/Mn family n=1 Tax=Bacillus sp. FJAT-27445 TaxID=1679166 RepID=UPI000743C498|nr:zinc ABC transporter substrate-binding protein [Bacillus sp. FJAT-27445]